MTIFLKNSRKIALPSSRYIQYGLYLLSALLTIICIVVALQKSKFHRNLRNIFVNIIIIWFELILSRLLVFEFQNQINDDNDVHILDNCSLYANCDLYRNGFDLIFIAANLRYHYMYFMIHGPIAILIERIFATILVHDYEKKKRRWIFYIITTVQFLASVLLSIITTTIGITFFMLILYVSTTMFLTAIIYGLVEYINKRRLDVLEKNHRRTKYTLSIRYQLKENLKTIRLMRRFFLSIITYIVVMSMANSIPVLLHMKESVVLDTREYLDYVFHNNPMFIVPTAFITIESYRRCLLNKAKSTFGIRMESRKLDLKKLKLPHSQSQADVYFEIFNRQLKGETSQLKAPMKKSKTTDKF